MSKYSPEEKMQIAEIYWPLKYICQENLVMEVLQEFMEFSFPQFGYGWQIMKV